MAALNKLSKLIVFGLLAACLVSAVFAQIPGGLDAERPADEQLEKVMKRAHDKLQTSFPGGFKKIEPVSYRTQVVSGMNYFVKVKVTDNSGSIKHAHLRLYRPFNSEIEVHGIKTDVTEESPLKYFQMP